MSKLAITAYLLCAIHFQTALAGNASYLGRLVPDRDLSCAALFGELDIPPSSQNFVQTTAGFGYMTVTVDDPFSQMFIDFATSGVAPGPALDIGCAFGVACSPILQRGYPVIAMDPGFAELEVLYSITPVAERKQLTLIHGLFPHHSDLPANSVGAILISRVFHFLEPKEIRDALQEAYRVLAPGGRIYITAETPHFKLSEAAGFVAEYEQRKAAGYLWPGLNENVAQLYPNIKSGLPAFMNYMDPDIFRRELALAGFQVLEAYTFARPKFRDDIRGDGRESAGVAAAKPSAR